MDKYLTSIGTANHQLIQLIEIKMSEAMEYLQSLFYTEEESTLWERVVGECLSAVSSMWPYAVTLYVYLFFSLLVIATIGRKFKIRKFYIEVLDRLFRITAVKMEEQVNKEKIQRKLSFKEIPYDSETEEDDAPVSNDIETIRNRPLARSVNYIPPIASENEFRNRRVSDNQICNNLNKTYRSLSFSSENLDITIESKMDNLNDDSCVIEKEAISLPEILSPGNINRNIKNVNDDLNGDISNKQDQRVYSLIVENCNGVKNRVQPNKQILPVGPPSAKVADDSAAVNCGNYPEQCENTNTGNKMNTSTSLSCNSSEVYNSSSLTSTTPLSNEISESSSESLSENSDKDLNGSVPARRDVKFPLDAPMLFISAGVRAIVDDCVSSSFSPEQLKTWNLLSRSIMRLERIRNNKALAVFFLCGLLLRYLFFTPMRVLVLTLSLANLCVCTFLVGCLPTGRIKRIINTYVVCFCFDFIAGSLSVVARFHNKENRPTHGIAVANHTSPIDAMVLGTDNCYDMVGQRTKGLLGVFMNALAKSSSHIWFERTEMRDREAISKLLLNHTQDRALPPLLIFPEGVCVNNTAVLEFRKGAFEMDCDIFPVAMRFDPVYGDAFWFQGGFASYCLSMMTSWAIVCDVFYLPPMRRAPGESGSIFAGRVRSVIAQKVGLLELNWNSIVKTGVFSKEKWHKMTTEKQMEQQRRFARNLSENERDELGEDNNSA